MAKILPEFQFFYLIETSHYFIHDGKSVHRVGYGITIRPRIRVCQYSDQSGGEQAFTNVFYGPYGQIVSLENLVKEKTASKTHYIYGEPVEWLSPNSGMTIQDLNSLVLDIIDTEPFDIYPLKPYYLPFDNRPRHNSITPHRVKMNPLKYLDVVQIPDILLPYQDM
jgi:hypothetical protein